MGALSSPSKQVHRPLVFALNGERVELHNVDPATTLLSYIRSETRFKGPKRGCGEGGCGACSVIISKYNPETREVKESSINSCLALLCSVDGCAVTTSEGLGNSQASFHAVQKRISAFHGTQCGFCTPGMTMAIYSCLKHTQQLRSKSPAMDGNGAAAARQVAGSTSAELERALQGNICRCTGYRPLLDVCKSFASDVDLEDLGINTCWANNAEAKHENLPPYNPKMDPQFPEFLITELDARKKRTLEKDTAGLSEIELAGESLDARFKHVEGSKEEKVECSWVSTGSLAQLSVAMKALKGRREQLKLVVGNTSSGYYKDHRPEVFVDVSQIPELLSVRRDSHGLEIGAATRIAELIDYLEEFEGNPVAAGLADHMKKIAGNHVRNWGSVGGNLVMAQRFAFESDLATILLGAGASVKIVTFNGLADHSYATEKLSLYGFLERGAMDHDSILQSVYIPLEEDTGAAETSFRCYRASPRPYGNAISYANAAFHAHVSSNREQGTIVIESVRLAFGAFGTKHAIRASKVEKLLGGTTLTLAIVKKSVDLLKTELVPVEGTDKKEYRVSLAVGFLFEFLNSLLSSEATVAPTPLFPHVGKQLVRLTDDQYPISQPRSKLHSLLQASGEAEYVDDIPSPPRCLHAAFVLSSEAHAKLEAIDAKVALESPRAIAYMSLRDIPEGGQNVGIVNNYNGYETESLFAEDIVGYVGQPLGVMVAETYDLAKLAAGKVKVTYDTSSVEPPILTVDDAVAKNSIFPVPPFVLPSQHQHIGDAGKALAEAECQLSGEFSTVSQSHFYMETQVALAVPGEDGSLTVYNSTQSPDFLQQAIGACLNIPLNKIQVICRRLGGSFGGKVLRNQHVAVAVALAAHKLRRPVRMSLDRNTDMQIIGGRVPWKAKFAVGFTKAGKITAAKVDTLIELGWFSDFYLITPAFVDSTVKKYNFGTLDLSFTMCKTNNVPKTAVRSPGHAQCNVIAEAILDHVASYLGVSGNKVREENLHTFESLVLFQNKELLCNEAEYTLPAIWAQLRSQARVEERELEVQKFNDRSKWLKRGLCMAPIVYGAGGVGNQSMVSIFQDGSVVVQIGGIETGQGLYTKVAQVVAYSLSPLCSKVEVSKILNKIQILPLDSLHLPNTFCDAGSTTSAATCAAAQQACEVLVQRLLPLKEQLAQAQPNGEVLWEDLCFTAKRRMMNLQSYEYWASPNYHYLIFGAGVSEVEVNILTGETRVLATDILYDGGKTLNAAIDVGQVEGAFVMGLGFVLTEEITTDSKGKVLTDGTWTYKPPTIDTIPRRFNVEFYKSPYSNKRLFSSKAVGEPPLLAASTVLSAIRMAIAAARKDYKGGSPKHDVFELNPPATVVKVKKLCGIDNVEMHLQSTLHKSNGELQSMLKPSNS